MIPNNTTLIKFLISSGEIHMVKYMMYELCEDTTSGYAIDSTLVSSDTNDSKCSSLGSHITDSTSCSTNHPYVSSTKRRICKLNECVTTL